MRLTVPWVDQDAAGESTGSASSGRPGASQSDGLGAPAVARLSVGHLAFKAPSLSMAAQSSKRGEVSVLIHSGAWKYPSATALHPVGQSSHRTRLLTGGAACTHREKQNCSGPSAEISRQTRSVGREA